jgi:hypothetical protein
VVQAKSIPREKKRTGSVLLNASSFGHHIPGSIGADINAYQSNLAIFFQLDRCLPGFEDNFVARINHELFAGKNAVVLSGALVDIGADLER